MVYWQLHPTISTQVMLYLCKQNCSQLTFTLLPILCISLISFTSPLPIRLKRQSQAIQLNRFSQPNALWYGIQQLKFITASIATAVSLQQNLIIIINETVQVVVWLWILAGASPKVCHECLILGNKLLSTSSSSVTSAVRAVHREVQPADRLP